MDRDKKDETSDVFFINREEISDPKIIANHFNDFFKTLVALVMMMNMDIRTT